MKITRLKEFINQTKKLDPFLKLKLKKQIKKIVENPEIGKPLKYKCGERSLYIKPFRLIYSYNKEEDILYLLKFEHRKKVYEKMLLFFIRNFLFQ